MPFKNPAMRSLTEADAKSWLLERGIQQAPYDMPEYISAGAYRQVQIPAGEQQGDAFAAAVVKACGTFQEALLHFTDWSIYTPAQMATIVAVLQAHGETRPLIEVPAQVFAGEETDLLSALLGRVIHFEWSAYLYVEGGPTFLAWEGELLDIWAPLDQKREIFESLDPFLSAGG